jgi:hypothetical protein
MTAEEDIPGQDGSGLLPDTSVLERLWRGGVVLSPLEVGIVSLFVENSPADFQSVLREQIGAANLVQRSPDWTELRFYTMDKGRVDRSGLAELPVRPGEIKLLSMGFLVEDATEPIHANFWAVDKRFVIINFDRSIKTIRHIVDIRLQRVRQSWRSNIEPK